MKRILCLIIAASTLLGITACSSPEVKETTPAVTDATETIPAVTAPVLDYTVANPTPYPDYSVPEDYTTDDLRQIAIRAMRDILTVEWTAAKYYTYKNKYSLDQRLSKFRTKI